MPYVRKSEAEKFLLRLPRFAGVADASYHPGLERITSLLEAMHRPQDAFESVHIAGTNGKGSTASMLASISTSAGLKVGLHTSPHLLQTTERMRVDGVPAENDWLVSAVDMWGGLISDVGASFFEAIFALSACFFRDRNVDLAVVEVGLGGRLDATNVLQPKLTIITQIGLDHQQILGATIAEIAAEKAGVIKEEIPVLAAPGDSEALHVISRTATNRNAPLHLANEEVSFETNAAGMVSFSTPEGTYENIDLELLGEHQNQNAALAIRAFELLELGATKIEEVIKSGLEGIRDKSGLRGRHELIWAEPCIVVDVAHNAHAMSAALDTMESRFGRVDKVYLGLMQDKDVAPFASLLKEKGIPVSTILIYDERAFDPDSLGTILRGLGLSVEEPSMDLFVTLDEIVQESEPGTKVLILGSHVVVAEALKWAGGSAS